ncbi:MAG TPA: SDR family NAD(P)-dependent oxidoreductase [Kofleriaceae bacterium]|nr:SDR family NAD(P)-dependent oxidoreductase [Kofleriaceae bacterium]
MERLADRVAWITGGASGIGLAIAHRLADEKVKLVLVDIEQAALDAAEAALKAKGASVLAIRADVASSAEVAAAAARAKETFGLVHIIVNNAGVGGNGGPMWSIAEGDWQWALGVNLWGVIHGIRHLLPALIESGEEGHVVNTASMAGLTSTPFMAPYTATKHAVVAMSECLAKELELAKSKVKVSVLCPGFVQTNINTSDRNRSKDYGSKTQSAGADKFRDVLATLVSSGKPAATVGEQVVSAIKTDKFYILTHPEMKPAIEHRMKQILEEQPPGIDPMMRALFGSQ